MDYIKFGDLRVGEIFKFDLRGITEYMKVDHIRHNMPNAGNAVYSNQPCKSNFFVLHDEIVIKQKE